jgi:hypothetical protein
MTVAGHLNRGRIRHQLLMLDTVVITRPGVRTWSPITQEYASGATTVYTGPCRIVVWRGNEEEAADVKVNVFRYRLDLPFTAATPIILRRDIATITASVNPWMVGKIMTITEPEIDTTATALRVIGEVTT